MAWQQWVYVALAIVGTLAVVVNIGKERKPITPSLAAYVVATQCVYVALVLTI